MHGAFGKRFGWLALVAALFVLSVATPLAAAIGPDLRAAPLSAEFLRYQADLKLRHTLGLDRIPGFRPGLIPAPMDRSYLKDIRSAPPMTTYASTYDLRTQGKLTSVKDQGAYGTCWTFATFGSLESYLMPGDPEDFSEDNLARQSGYGVFSDGAYDHGGNAWMSTAYLARWGGPVNESEDAYGDSTTPSGLSARKHVQQVDWIPPRTSSTDNDGVKAALTQFGAVYVSMMWEGDTNSTTTYFNASTSAYYDYNAGTSTDHAVLIVGWDDNYSASNFSTAPPGNGAFIIRNSWGTSWGQSGFFYISYYDTRLGRSGIMATFNNAESTSNYSGIYQYDTLGDIADYGFSSSAGWLGNVFTAQSTASVSAVGFYTETPNSTYEVYTGSSLASKTLSTSGSFAYMGYHTVTLPSPLSITSGQQFAVAVKVTSPGTTFPIAIEYPTTGYSEAATASSGQSYVSQDGSSWTDLTIDVPDGNVCLKAYTTGGSSPSPSASPSTSPSPSPSPSPGNDDDIPGVAIPASPFDGNASRDTDMNDVFYVDLEAGETLTASITGPAGTDFDLYLYPPGTTTVNQDGGTVAAANGNSYPDAFTYAASESGRYYLDVWAYVGAGSYTVTYSVSSTPADNVGPQCYAKNVTVKHGKVCKIYFKVYDAQGPEVTTVVKITTRSGAVKKKWSWGYDTNSATWYYTKYPCRLAKGTYKIVVTGKDSAGNPQSRIGRATLTVK